MINLSSFKGIGATHVFRLGGERVGNCRFSFSSDRENGFLTAAAEFVVDDCIVKKEEGRRRFLKGDHRSVRLIIALFAAEGNLFGATHSLAKP